MKKKTHLVSIKYDTPMGHYLFTGLIEGAKGNNGKTVCFPCEIFQKQFGFKLPAHSTFQMR